MACGKWERLVELAEGNTMKSLEFKEKLVECIVYTVQERVRRGKIKGVEEFIKYGRAMAQKFGIEELNFHLSLLEREAERIKERRAAQIK